MTNYHKSEKDKQENTGRRSFLKTSAFLGMNTMLFGMASTSCKSKNILDPVKEDKVNKAQYRISTASGMLKVMPGDVLPESRTARISLAGNERESFQIVVRAKEDIDGVKVTIGDFTNNQHRLNSIKWSQVGYVYISTFSGHPTTGDVKGRQPGWYPDPLLERDSVKLMRDWSNAIWFTIHAPAGTPAGTYKGKITLEIKGVKEEISVEALVHNFALPAVPTLPNLFSLSVEYLDGMYDGFTGEIRKNWFDLLLASRMCPTDLYLNMNTKEGRSKITATDYSSFKGLTNGFVIYPITATWADRSAPAEELIARFEQNRPYIDQILATGAVANGKGVFYGFDECEPEHFEVMRKVNKYIKEQYPQVPIATTSQYVKTVEQLDDLGLDILIMHIFDGIYNNTFADQVRNAGKKVWAYISLQPYYPMPNWRIENPLQETRVLLGAMAYKERFDGFLYWGLNQYNKGNRQLPAKIKRNSDLKLEMSITTPTDEYKWLHGDGLLIYPGENGPLSSIRMENIREGLEDYEYYKLVEQKLGSGTAAIEAGKIARNTRDFERNEDNFSQHRIALAKLIG
ncbi:DUF4091 domain-containing protein [Pedobacter nyackensis]|uniref:DUF4091 domain-containing protein n=1 Tax=Pedobacter nyackensis TaxID=475255 RepID=UPI00293028B3|nr:DUF4091 domain-containing protein [Pedobacter nyackensis]